MSANLQTYLQKKNPHVRDNFITFDEPSHVYTIELKDANGRIYFDSTYTSVTTWCHSHFSKFDADKIINNMMSSRRWLQSKYYGMTKDEIKKLWEDNRRNSAEAGTKLHYDIECFYNNYPKENDSIEYKYFLKFEKDRTKKNGFGEFLIPYRTEWMIYDEELKLSGSVDMIYEDVRDGSIYIYDWKRSKEIKKTAWNNAKTECICFIPDSNYWHYTLQLNTYKLILERNYDKQVKGLYLVCLHPENTNESYQRINVPIITNEMNALVADRKKRMNT